MEAEVAALSQLQLQLLALVSELRILRERERAAHEELRDAGQRWDEAEEERRREARELRVEVEVRDEAICRLEARIKCLESENEVLGKNEKNLKESMEVLLQSREAFIKRYEAGLYLFYAMDHPDEGETDLCNFREVEFPSCFIQLSRKGSCCSETSAR